MSRRNKAKRRRAPAAGATPTGQMVEAWAIQHRDTGLYLTANYDKVDEGCTLPLCERLHDGLLFPKQDIAEDSMGGLTDKEAFRVAGPTLVPKKVMTAAAAMGCGLREEDIHDEALIADLRHMREMMLDMYPDHERLATEDAFFIMCFESGLDALGPTLIERIGDPSALTFDRVGGYNLEILRAGLRNLQDIMCSRWLDVAIAFARRLEAYGNTLPGRQRALEETGFFPMPAAMATRFFAEHAADLERVQARSLDDLGMAADPVTAQLVTITAGLSAIAHAEDESIPDTFGRTLRDPESTVEQLGKLVVSMGVRALEEQIDQRARA